MASSFDQSEVQAEPASTDDANGQNDDVLNGQDDDDLNGQDDNYLNVQYDNEALDRPPDPDLYDAPFIDAELESLIQSHEMVSARKRYEEEAGQEAVRLVTCLHSNPNPNFDILMDANRGAQIRRVIVRHYIKKRWEHLGVWNPLWGIPGRVNQREIDNPATWTWKWERTYLESDPNYPIRRVIRLRQGLRRAESGPVPLCGSLASDASPDEAEGFLMSRPFFVWILEGHEEQQRMRRGWDLTWDIRNILLRRWEQRQDWKEEWYDRGLLGCSIIGWTWPHENPFSEVPPYDELNSIDDIEFTPSETDALEAIDEEFRLEQTWIAQVARQDAARGAQDALLPAHIRARIRELYGDVGLRLPRAQHPSGNGVDESGPGHLGVAQAVPDVINGRARDC